MENGEDKQVDESLENHPWLLKYAPILNFTGLGMWLIATLVLLYVTATQEYILYNQLRYLGNVVVSVSYGILTMIAGVIAVNLFTPWFSFVELFKGDGMSKLSGAIIFASIVIGIAMIFYAAN